MNSIKHHGETIKSLSKIQGKSIVFWALKAYSELSTASAQDVQMPRLSLLLLPVTDAALSSLGHRFLP